MENSKNFVVLFAIVLLFVQQAVAYDDSNKLNLSVSVTEEYIYIGARGGFQPNVYYRVLDDRYLNRYAVINKESVDDPGRVIWAIYSSRDGEPDSAYVDGNNAFLAAPGEDSMGLTPPLTLKKPSADAILATISPNSARELSLREAQRSIVAPLSAFDIIAKDLLQIHTQFIDLEDVDYTFLSIDDNFFGNNRLRELRPLMSALKNAGFRNVCFGSLNDDEGFRNRAYKEAYKELYSPFNLEPSNKCVAMTTGVSESKKNQKFTKDIDKVLKEVAGLQTKGKSVAGNRCNNAEGDSCGDGLARLLGKDRKACGSIKTPKKDKYSYALGAHIGNQARFQLVTRDSIDLDLDIFIQAFKERYNEDSANFLMNDSVIFLTLTDLSRACQTEKNKKDNLAVEPAKPVVVSEKRGNIKMPEKDKYSYALGAHFGNQARFQLVTRDSIDLDLDIFIQAFKVHYTEDSAHFLMNDSMVFQTLTDLSQACQAKKGGGSIATKVNGSVRIPAESDIDVAGNSRSPADIAKIIRQRAPGLRHIYNKFLKKKPGFLGKVTLRLMIAPDGKIVSISVVSSTTGFSEFDCEIKDAVSRWKFGKVRFGNASVTIPFTFSE